eukprot:scaffold30763_cov52-Attheya_sp.AAC.2
MTEKGSGNVRNDFLSCSRGDSLRITGGTYTGHLALFNSVKKAWIEVRVRKCPGVHRPADHMAGNKEYLTTYLPPFHLEKAPELCSQDRLISALSQARHHIDVVPPVPLYLGSGSRVKRVFESIHALLDTLEIPSTDTDLIEYSLDLGQLVKIDLVKLSRGERTVVQRLTDPKPKAQRLHYVGSDEEDGTYVA